MVNFNSDGVLNFHLHCFVGILVSNLDLARGQVGSHMFLIDWKWEVAEFDVLNLFHDLGDVHNFEFFYKDIFKLKLHGGTNEGHNELQCYERTSEFHYY